MKLFLELWGWYGAAAILGAYALVSFALIEPTSVMYQILNATGAAGIVAVSFYKGVYQPGVLNVIWLLIAVVAIANVYIG